MRYKVLRKKKKRKMIETGEEIKKISVDIRKD